MAENQQLQQQIAEMATMIQQLQTALQLQQQELQQQQRDFQQQQQPAEPEPAPAPNPVVAEAAPPPVRGLKMAAPDIFSGSRAKADTFLRQVTLFMIGRPGDFPADKLKITFMLSYMKGGIAGQWADRKVELYSDGHTPMPPWDEFREDFRQAFADPDQASTARIAMTRLVQGNRTADEYITDFVELASRTAYNETAHIEAFERGLHPQLVEKIYALPVMPEILDDWYEYASRFDQQWRKLQARRTAGAGAYQYSQNRSSAATPARYPTPATPTTTPTAPSPAPAAAPPRQWAAMDIDRTRTVRNCFNCGKPGHIARECPEPRRAGQPRPGFRQSIRQLIQQEMRAASSAETPTTASEGDFPAGPQ